MTRWRFLTPKQGLVLLLWLLALALVGWTLRQLPLNDIVSQLGLLTWPDWLLWTLVNITIFYLAVKRWQLLGQALQVPLSLANLFRLRQAGSAVSFLTPGPHFGGEPLQLYWLCRHFGKPLHSAAAMLGLDRFMETATNISVLLAGVLMLLGTAILPVQEWLQVTAILASVLLAMVLAATLMLRHPDWLANRFRPLVQRWRNTSKVEPGETANENDQGKGRALVSLMQQALAVQRPRLWLALLLSLAGWGALLFELALLLHLLGVSVSPADLVLIMVGMRLAMLLPVPGGIGTIEASLLWSFRFLGLPVSAAIGLIALIRLRDALVLLVGLGCLWSFHRPRFQPEPASAK
ncbi:lysylphosphatidylglycerol synthase transmembrane domain-containing protein [Saccharospirillum impatiens]|uniref:lysylphosphatidylglycerol synthase transmembrane domain-containing protein n=1 Tax=Saccharospirillum impatiens TaxID=169438 RepID=UPI00040800C2|nr:lysylphosphatidylglycerol synthase transmembrane domain-containing protein [Saccharospirillum impatiens]